MTEFSSIHLSNFSTIEIKVIDSLIYILKTAY